jgi:sensor histidine kinase YesM
MEKQHRIDKKSRFPYIYELLLWLIYVCLYKYSYYVEAAPIPHGLHLNFPYPQLILYAIAMTLYTIPFYRWLAPMLLRKRKYGWFGLATLLYFGLGAKWAGWLVSFIFHALSTDPVLVKYYEYQYLNLAYRSQGIALWDLNLLVTDLIAFLSLTFTWYAFENERKKHLLEKDNLVLQLESLKAQLHPHFLFNTLNNIYGMSLIGDKQTPDFILRLSDMMRFILYDCQQNKVALEKDIAFLDNYLEMEKRRYPAADIQFTVTGDATGKQIAPLLFIQFLENSFKHGAHRLNDTGFIHGSLTVHSNSLTFELRNDVFAVPTPANMPAAQKQYGGVGINNVRQRLALYYPGKHTLTIHSDNTIFEVRLTLSLS